MRTKAELGRLAQAVREETGCGRFEPFDPWAWSKDNGVPFLSLDDLDISAEARDHFTVDRPGAWSAALTRAGMQHLVIYNPSHSAERTRSNLAHEVAHFAAEHALSDAWMDDSGRCGATSKSDEKEATELAGALLVPAEVAKAHAIRGKTAESLAETYGVSAEMANWRMQMSGGPTIAKRSVSRRGLRRG
ncbi:ImmA/IrrE family metallo-endopeptidase [uncultured Friedmanniella sp.]|uniref:ImmA/IrrE family metallo-endopeptidase n=1 Tax=uncultured Friedmanniella sp. TaxID=335381 RepID=UPI0035C9C887